MTVTPKDGTNEAPEIANPACAEPNPGCGEWVAPTIKIPDYKASLQF